jgi:hypothetical protein
MTNVYLLGHGFIWMGGAQTSGRFVTLIAPLKTYVKEDTYLDGKGIARLLDQNDFGWYQNAPEAAPPPLHAGDVAGGGLAAQLAAKKAHLHHNAAPAQVITHGNLSAYDYPKGQTIREHLLYTAPGDTNTNDLGNCDQYNQAMHDNNNGSRTISFQDNFGSLLRLANNDYIYRTADYTLTPLSDIQRQIDVYLPTADYKMHWCACRSAARCDTLNEVVTQVNGGLMANNKPNERITNIATSQ